MVLGLRVAGFGAVGCDGTSHPHPKGDRLRGLGVSERGDAVPLLPDAFPVRALGARPAPASRTAGSGKLFNPFGDATVPELRAEPAG